MSFSGRGVGVYVEDLDETFGKQELTDMGTAHFKQLCAFMTAPELQRVLIVVDNHEVPFSYDKTCYVQNVLSDI